MSNNTHDKNATIFVAKLQQSGSKARGNYATKLAVNYAAKLMANWQ
jgi:hypothetical protein